MPTLEEMSQWSNEQVHMQVLAKLAPGWTFEHTFVEEVGWCAYIRDSDDNVLWSHLGSVDPRLTLFGAYGWLFSRDAKPRHPAWVRRSQDMPPIRMGRMTAPGLPDTPTPEDIDPEEVRVVYENSSDPKRR